MFEVFGPLARPTPGILPLVVALLPLLGLFSKRRGLVALGLSGLFAAIELAWSMRWPAEERVVLSQLGVASRIGQLDLVLALALDPLGAFASVVVAAVAARLVLAQRAPRRIALLCVLASATDLVVLGDGAATVVLGLGIASIASAMLGRARLANVAADRVGELATVLAAGILFWALGGSWIAEQYVPELEPRVVVAKDAPAHRANLLDDDDREVAKSTPKRGARATLSLGSMPGALVLVDGTWLRDKRAITAPFEGAPISAGAHAFRVHPGPGSDDYVVPRANVAENERVTLALQGATTTFREVHDDLVARDALGDAAGKSALARRRFFGGISVVGVILALVALGLAARARLFPFAASRDEPARALGAFGALVVVARYAMGELAPTSAANVAIALGLCSVLAAASALREGDARALLAAEIAFAGAGAVAGAPAVAIVHGAVAALLFSRSAPTAIAHVAFVPTRVVIFGALAALRYGWLAAAVGVAAAWLAACALSRLAGRDRVLPIVASVAAVVLAFDARVFGAAHGPLASFFEPMPGAFAPAATASLPLAVLALAASAFAWGASRGDALNRFAKSPILATITRLQPLTARASSALALACASALSELEARLGAVIAFADRFLSAVGSFFSAIDELVFRRVRVAIPLPDDRATRFILVPIALLAAGAFALPWLT
jgi:hypothetical protein